MQQALLSPYLIGPLLPATYNIVDYFGMPKILYSLDFQTHSPFSIPSAFAFLIMKL